MATPVNITALQRADNVSGTFGPFNVTITTAGSALLIYGGVYRASTVGELMTAPTASGLTFVLVTDGTTDAKALKATDSGGGTGRSGHYWWVALNCSAGTKAVTINFVNATANFGCFFGCEIPGVPTTGAYCSVVVNATYAGVQTSVAATISASLSQAKNTILAAANGLGTNIWNGGGSGDGVQPAGWSMLRGYCVNFPIDGHPFQAAYQDVNSIAPVSASWTTTNASLAEGFTTTILALLDSADSNYVKILVTPDTGDGVVVNASTGWIVHIAAADPKNGYTVYSGISAQATGNEIRVVGAAGSVAVGGTVNVQVVNAGLGYTSGWGVGTVEAAP